MKNSIFACMLALLLCLFALPVLAAEETKTVSYVEYSWDEGTQTLISQVKEAECTPLESSSSSRSIQDGWYVVSGSVRRGGALYIDGDVKIILTDGADLRISGGFYTLIEGSLAIYAQENGTGSLSVDWSGYNDDGGDAGIGGGEDDDCFAIHIHGGNITTRGEYMGAGLGAGEDGVCGQINIFSGKIYTTDGGYGGGIAANNINIYGGEVDARGNVGITSSNLNIYGGRVVTYGSGNGIESDNVNIHGGWVETHAGSVFFERDGVSAKNVNITGGVLVAEGSNYKGRAGYGIGWKERATISGGNVFANCSSAPSDGTSKLAWHTLTLDGAADGTPVTGLYDAEGNRIAYGLKDVKTLEDKLYIYLPENQPVPEKVNMTAAGTYQLDAEQSSGNAHVYTYWKTPALTPVPGAEVKVTEGDAVQLSVEVSDGGDVQNFRWYKDVDGQRVPLEDGELYAGTNSKTLTINSAAVEMDGTKFVCIAANPAGSAEASIVMRVKRLPEPVIQPPEPVDQLPKTGDDSMLVLWLALMGLAVVCARMTGRITSGRRKEN